MYLSLCRNARTHFFAPPKLLAKESVAEPAFIMYYVYIVKSQKDNSYYTGFTSDLENRIKEYNSGSGDYSSTKFPFELVWHCCFKDKMKAIQFEKYLKSGSGFAFARKRLV